MEGKSQSSPSWPADAFHGRASTTGSRRRSIPCARAWAGSRAPTEAAAIWDEEAHHHSTALERNALVLNEVRKFLSEGRAVGCKELKEHLEVVGYGAAARWVYGQALDPSDDHR